MGELINIFHDICLDGCRFLHRIQSIDILKEALFKFQLERDTFTSTAFELTLTVTSDGGGSVFASLDWEEISK